MAADLGGNPQPLAVLYAASGFPASTAHALVWPANLAPQTVLLSTNGTTPLLAPGQPYFLTVTNTNAFSVQFAIGVWFDILTLTNCQTLTNAVAGPAGIPSYFQFDVPTNGAPPGVPQDVAFWLGNASSNVTVVLSQHLPLPDLGHFDYFSGQPGSNAEIVMVVDNAMPGLGAGVIGTNSTPWPVETNRWYVGVFNAAQTNVSFNLQACYSTNFPTIITLTNGVPYTATLRSPYVAPPGPPRSAFFMFQITNPVPGVLFELYDVSGNAGLVLQRDGLPTMAPYFGSSFLPGAGAQQIVVRSGQALADLSGLWYLGVYNNELSNNVAFTIRATLPVSGILPSAVPLVLTNQNFGATNMLLSWYSIVGEWYQVNWTDGISITNSFGSILATTPMTTYVVPLQTNGTYTVTDVSVPLTASPTLHIQLWTNDIVRLYWGTNYPGFTLEYTLSVGAPGWIVVNQPVGIEGANYVVYDTIINQPKYYRLIHQ
jgi:hypothetical protein